MTNSTDLVRKDSIEELCNHRARAMELYVLAMNTMKEAMAAHSRACIGQSYTTTREITDAFRYPPPPERFAETVRIAIDRDMWRGFIINTPLGSLMDTQERKKFEDSLKEIPPECTPDTVFATMSRLAGEAGLIFRRGLVNVFAKLCRDYRSHDGFKIGDRVIIESLVTQFGLNHYRDDLIVDVDRCFHVLDNKPAPEYQQGIRAAMRTAIAAKSRTAETEYFSVKWFGNGNAHFRFKRPDLVERANKLIAEHFGDTLGMGADAATEAKRRPVYA